MLLGYQFGANFMLAVCPEASAEFDLSPSRTAHPAMRRLGAAAGAMEPSSPSVVCTTC
jgi:hypothetical protein